MYQFWPFEYKLLPPGLRKRFEAVRIWQSSLERFERQWVTATPLGLWWALLSLKTTLSLSELFSTWMTPTRPPMSSFKPLSEWTIARSSVSSFKPRKFNKVSLKINLSLSELFWAKRIPNLVSSFITTKFWQFGLIDSN